MTPGGVRPVLRRRLPGARGRGGLALGAVLLLTAGCAVGPNFVPPRPAVPASFGSEPTDVRSTTVGSEVDPAWWRSFKDPLLTTLVERLAAQNLDLKMASERLLQARAQREVAASQGLPQIDGQAKYTHEKESKNGLPSLVEPAPGAPLEFNLYQPQVTASWEIDLFGRVRRLVEADSANALAQAQARRALALEASAELAQDYLTLRALQARERVLDASLAAARDRVRLVETRFANGVATTLDVAQAQAQEAGLRQNLPDLRAQEARMINAVSLLLGEAPRALEHDLVSPAALPLTPPQIPVGLPGALLRRRPDVLEAEARLHAATAETGVAVADFFPNLTLNGTFGYESLHTDNLFTWPSSAFTIGPTLSIPIFEGGRLKGTLRLRRSQQREAALAYRKTVLQALHDVDNALTAYAEAQHKEEDVASDVGAEEKALAAAEDQYRQGAVNLLNVVEAQTGLYRSQSGLAEARADVATSLVRLYKALGGGWDSLAPRPPA